MNTYINEPLEINMNVPAGNYEVLLTLKAHSDANFSVCSQNNSILLRDQTLKAGNSADITVAVCVFEKPQPTPNSLSIRIATDDDITITAALSPAKLPTIFICGDSDAISDQPISYPFDPIKSACGWGQSLPAFISPSATVANYSQPDADPKALSDTILSRITSGDILIISFGNTEHRNCDTLKTCIRDIAKNAVFKGAEVIICSPINADADVCNATAIAAKELGLTFIDMSRLSAEILQDKNLVSNSKNDDICLNSQGADLIAKLFLQDIIRQDNCSLAQHIDIERLDTDKM